jgi:DNA-binding HxlR family transcriptional regulator
MDGPALPLCPRFHRAVELIGRRWTGAVLQQLMAGRRRYSDLKAAVPEISDRMLSERLRELEAEHLVRRIVTPDTPVRVEYELTERGRSLEEPLAAIAAWAAKWIAVPEEAPAKGGAAAAAAPAAEPTPPAGTRRSSGRRAIRSGRADSP